LAIKPLSLVAVPDLCDALWLGAHPCLLRYFWPRPPYWPKCPGYTHGRKTHITYRHV